MHTPGPWKIVGPDKDGIRGPKGNMIAECIGYSDKATDPAQRAQGGRESNARLIAASPELLGMLSEAVRLAELGRIMDGETLREAKKIIVRAVQGE